MTGDQATARLKADPVDAQHTRDRNHRLFLRIACRSSNNAQAFRIEIASCRNAATLPTGWHVQWQKNKEGIYRMGIGPAARLSKDA